MLLLLAFADPRLAECAKGNHPGFEKKFPRSYRAWVCIACGARKRFGWEAKA